MFFKSFSKHGVAFSSPILRISFRGANIPSLMKADGLATSSPSCSISRSQGESQSMRIGSSRRTLLKHRSSFAFQNENVLRKLDIFVNAPINEIGSQKRMEETLLRNVSKLSPKELITVWCLLAKGSFITKNLCKYLLMELSFKLAYLTEADALCVLEAFRSLHFHPKETLLTQNHSQKLFVLICQTLKAFIIRDSVALGSSTGVNLLKLLNDLELLSTGDLTLCIFSLIRPEETLSLHQLTLIWDITEQLVERTIFSMKYGSLSDEDVNIKRVEEMEDFKRESRLCLLNYFSKIHCRRIFNLQFFNAIKLLEKHSKIFLNATLKFEDSVRLFYAYTMVERLKYSDVYVWKASAAAVSETLALLNALLTSVFTEIERASNKYTKEIIFKLCTSVSVLTTLTKAYATLSPNPNSSVTTGFKLQSLHQQLALFAPVIGQLLMKCSEPFGLGDTLLILQCLNGMQLDTWAVLLPIATQAFACIENSTSIALLQFLRTALKFPNLTDYLLHSSKYDILQKQLLVIQRPIPSELRRLLDEIKEALHSLEENKFSQQTEKGISSQCESFHYFGRANEMHSNFENLMNTIYSF